jgi:hypothetical protein
MVKRVRMIRTHMLLLTHLRSKMPIFFGKEDTQKDLIEDLEFQYAEIAKKHKLSIGTPNYFLAFCFISFPGDFPPAEKMKPKLKVIDFSTIEKWNQELFDDISQVLYNELPKLLIVWIIMSEFGLMIAGNKAD